MQLRPILNMIVLEDGDMRASHVGSTDDDLRVRPLEISKGMPDELRAALEEVLEDLSFDDWESTADQ